MNIDSAKHPRDIVLTCYICDDQYTGDRIESHLDECKYDWNIEEIDKPANERIPLPKPTSEFTKLFEAAKQLAMRKEQEENGKCCITIQFILNCLLEVNILYLVI